MKFTTLSRRTAAAGAASALVAGALVGVTTTAAQAEATTTSYTCTNPDPAGAGPWAVSVVSNIVGLDASDKAGRDVPAGLAVTNSFTIPDDARDTLNAFTVENLTFPDYAGALGSTSLAVSGMTAKVSEMTDNGNNTWSFDANGTTAAFEVPEAGTYAATAPSGFTLSAEVPGFGQVPSTCTLATGPAGQYQSVTVTKNDSAAKASSQPRVAKGDPVKVNVKVNAQNETPSGKVVLKLGTKTVDSANLNAKGVAKLKYPAKKVGKNKLKAFYKGDGYTNKSTDSLVVKVTR